MQVSPVDLQAWAEATGNPYPATAADKAAVLPAVIAWKQGQEMASRSERGPNLLAAPMAIAAGAGLGLAGLAAYRHFRGQGATHQEAADAAAQLQADAVRATAEGPSARPEAAPARSAPAGPVSYAGDLRVTPQDYSGSDTAVVRDSKGKIRFSRSGRAIDNGALPGANRSGTLQARQRGEYDIKSPWNDPVLGPRMAAADTEELRRQLIGRLVVENPSVVDDVINALADRAERVLPIDVVESAADLPKRALIDDGNLFRITSTGETVVSNEGKWVSASPAGVRSRMAPTGMDAYGTTTQEEEGGALKQTRRTSGAMFQDGWYPGEFIVDDNGNRMGDPDNGMYRLNNPEHRRLAEDKLQAARRETAAQLTAAGRVQEAQALLDMRGRIGESNLAEIQADFNETQQRRPAWVTDKQGIPVQDRDGNLIQEVRTVDGKQMPVMVRDNFTSDTRLDSVLSDKEDQLTKGLMEPLPASRSSFTQQAFDARPLVRISGGADPSDPSLSPAERAMAFANNFKAQVAAERDIASGLLVATPKHRYVENEDGTLRYELVGPKGPDGRTIVQWENRRATPQDLVTFEEREYSLGMPYRGKTASEAVSGMPTANYDYSRPDDPGSYEVVLEDGSKRMVERAPFQQSAYILKEPGNTLNRALAAAQMLSGEGVTTKDAYSLYSVDQPTVDRAVAFSRGELELPASLRSSRPSGKRQRMAVGGHTSDDWLTQVMSAMAVTPRPDAWALNKLERGSTREEAAELARGWLNANPGIAEVLESNMQGVPVQEQLNIVQEALGDAANDFPKALAWAQESAPELAARAQLGGPGSFGFDQFSKSYVRKAVLGAAAQLNNKGGGEAPQIVLPAAVSELLALEARSLNPANPNIAKAINRRIGGTVNPIEAVWKLDGILSDAASSSMEEGYTNGSKLAEAFFKVAQPGDGTRVGEMKARLGARTNDAYFNSFDGKPVGPTQGEEMASRMPVRIVFGTNVPGAGAGFNPDDSETSRQVTHTAIHGDGVTVNVDENVIDPSLAGTGKKMSPLQLQTGGAARAFATNRVLDNQYKALRGKIAEVVQAQNRGLITREEAGVEREKLSAELDRVLQRQSVLDKTREGNELLLQGSNRAAQTSRGVEGRGYVLDFGRGGVVRAMPDIGSNVLSYEQVFEKPAREHEEGFDLATIQDSRREEGSTVRSDAPDGFALALGGVPRDSWADAVDTERQATEGLERLRLRQAALEKSRRFEAAKANILNPGSAPVRLQPSAAAPVSTAHTLAAARVPAVPAFTEEEAAVARAGYLADYMDRLVEGGIRSSADGKRLIFKNQGQLTKAGYSPTPSEATVAGRVAGLRKRGII